LEETVLLAVAAITSGALGGVPEAFAVHEISRFDSAISRSVDPAHRSPIESGTGSPTLTPLTTVSLGASSLWGFQPSSVSPAMLRSLTGQTLLTQLGLLPHEQLAAFAKANPAVIHSLIVHPPQAATVNEWWTALSATDRSAFAASAPQLAGNLDGVPFAVRNEANRSYLAKSIARAESALSAGIGRAQLVGERHRLEILKQIDRTLRAHSSGSAAPRQLVTFDPTGNARAAISIGDLSKADYVSYLVPGMFFTVQGQMYDWTTIAQTLYNEQAGWLKTLAKSDSSYQGKTAATVAWIGYSTPGVLDIASLSRADRGATLLGSAVQGVDAVRSGHQPFITLVAHSYGSTAAMIELAKGGVSVNALALIGSPGAATQSAQGLSVKNGDVYVGEAAWDPVVNTAFYGSDPGAPAFGARRMDVAAGVDPVTGKSLGASVGHLGYFDPGSQAMRNLALIGLNQGKLVTSG
jgi:hypothetical protein